MSKAISVQNLEFCYFDTPVLKDVSFTVNEGSFIGLIGPNGGGKTTLLKLIMGLLKPKKGSISIFGKSPMQARDCIAYVPQALKYDKDFPISVMEITLTGLLKNLPWYGCYLANDIERAEDALQKVGMLEFKNRPFGRLSGGQAQRVLIARALASNPKLLLLDEPTASVDKNAEAEIYSILKGLQGQITILMVTHNLQAAIELVEELICVQQTATFIPKDKVCEHFALGLYHSPLIKTPFPGNQGNL